MRVLVLGFIPIQLDSRVERAYAGASAKAPTATALVNTELWETWTWWFVGITYCTGIEGTPIRPTEPP